MSKKILFATTNEYKIREARAVFKDKNITVEPVALGLAELQELNQSVISLSKAKQAYAKLNQPVIVDDAGMFIESLDGFPGTLTSLVAKQLGIANIYKLITEDEPAVFSASVSYCDGNNTFTTLGSVHGVIKKIPINKNSLLSDVFFPVGEEDSLTMLTQAGYYSHRRIALEKLHALLIEKELI